jgi:osmoprotectant transport system substrate-binding protein
MRQLATALLAFLLLAFTGCTGKRRSVIRIGSKNFTEQVLLAEILAQHIESHAGLEVERRVNLGGTLLCHRALLAGEIDLYVEYTGTALTVILGEPPVKTKEEAYEQVKSLYASRFGLVVTEPLGFNNTFAMVVRGEDARRLKLARISDVARYAPKWRPGFGYEFMERPDGYRGLVRTYHLRFGAEPRTLELGLLYRALRERQVDIVAGNSTDGVIAAQDFTILADDRHYFPPYEAVPIAQRETLELHPKLRDVLRSLGGKISEQEMRRLNYQVDGEHRDVKQVARDFLNALTR